MLAIGSAPPSAQGNIYARVAANSIARSVISGETPRLKREKSNWVRIL
jgi:hypothetical protein